MQALWISLGIYVCSMDIHYNSTDIHDSPMDIRRRLDVHTVSEDIHRTCMAVVHRTHGNIHGVDQLDLWEHASMTVLDICNSRQNDQDSCKLYESFRLNDIANDCQRLYKKKENQSQCWIAYIKSGTSTARARWTKISLEHKRNIQSLKIAYFAKYNDKQERIYHHCNDLNS